MTGDLPGISEATDWKPRVYVIGAVAGLLIGALAAYLYVRASQENGPSAPAKIKTLDILKLVVALLGIIRQVTDLGASGAKK